MVLDVVLAFTVLSQVQSDQCQPMEMTKIGTINQGGYSFDYQSGHGDGCRFYRLRNRPGSQMTPVVWKEHRARDAFVFLDVELDACATERDARWKEAVHLSDEAPEKSTTYLGFGVNKDQHKQTAQAFRSTPVISTQGYPKITTILRVLDGDDPNARLVTGIRASSEVKGEKGRFELIYTLASLDPESTYEFVRPGARPSVELNSVVWEAAASQPFLAAFDKLPLKRLSPGGPELQVTVSAEALEVVRNRLLRIVNREGRTMMATSSLTYVPATTR